MEKKLDKMNKTVKHINFISTMFLGLVLLDSLGLSLKDLMILWLDFLSHLS